MGESGGLYQVREIIQTLKQLKEIKDSLPAKFNGVFQNDNQDETKNKDVLISDSVQVCENFDFKTQSDLIGNGQKNYSAELNITPSMTPLQQNFNKSDQLSHIINKLQARKEQESNLKCSIPNNHCDKANLCCMSIKNQPVKRTRESVLNTISAELNIPPLQQNLNKNDKLSNIINKLQAREEQISSLKCSTSNNHCGKVNLCCTSTKNQPIKRTHESVLNTSGEIVRKPKSVYKQKDNDKKLKVNHSIDNKQSHLTQFYSQVKFTNNTDTNSYHNNDIKSLPTYIVKISNKCGNGLTENVNYTSLNNDNDFLYSQQNSKSQENVGDILYNIKKLTKHQKLSEDVCAHDMENQNKAIHGKESRLKKSFDDICNDITTDLGVIKDIPNSLSEGNTFQKSLSSGIVTQEKGSQRDAHSLPTTAYEIKRAEERLKRNIDFEKFLEKILNKNKNEHKENNKSKVCDMNMDSPSNRENDLEIITEEKNFPFKDLKPSNMKDLNSDPNKKSIGPIILPQYSDSENRSQTSEYSNHAYNSNFYSEVLANSRKYEFSSSSDFLKHNSNLSPNITISNKLISGSKHLSESMKSIHTNRYKNGKIESDVSQSFNENLTIDIEQDHQDHNCSMNEENISQENFLNCVCNNDFTKDETSFSNPKNSIGTQINLLDNDLEKSVLTSVYKRYIKCTEDANSETQKSGKLDNFLKNVKPNNRNNENCVQYKNNIVIKRYRKGKTKIYKLKKIRKKCVVTEEINEDLDVHNILKKLTSNSYEINTQLSRCKSGSSISTASSYSTDDSKSDTSSIDSKELTSPQQRLRNSFNELSKDKSLRYAEKEWEDAPEYDKEAVKIKIQDIFFEILGNMTNKRTAFLKHRRQTMDNCIFKNGRLQLKPVEESSMTVISSRAPRSKAKYQLMLYVMNKIQTLLETDTRITKRELYYQLKSLISDQRVSDRAINAISCVLDVGMWTLNIIAQKGLVFGNLKLLLSSGEMLNCNIPGTLIPQDINDIVEVHSMAYFILVVEKESIFHKLIEEDLPNKLSRPFIMITGKGFPDLNTQLFLRKLWIVMSIPVFILVDADPDGINIMLNYRFGSVHNAHVSQHLAVPNARWLGIYPSEVMNFNIASQPLTERELKLVNSILRTPYMSFSPKLVDELNILITRKYKAGIEGLMKTDNYLSEVYLPNKFFTHNFI